VIENYIEKGALMWYDETVTLKLLFEWKGVRI